MDANYISDTIMTLLISDRYTYDRILDVDAKAKVDAEILRWPGMTGEDQRNLAEMAMIGADTKLVGDTFEERVRSAVDYARQFKRRTDIHHPYLIWPLPSSPYDTCACGRRNVPDYYGKLQWKCATCTVWPLCPCGSLATRRVLHGGLVDARGLCDTCSRIEVPCNRCPGSMPIEYNAGGLGRIGRDGRQYLRGYYAKDCQSCAHSEQN
jgi:hypothetical protein